MKALIVAMLTAISIVFAAHADAAPVAFGCSPCVTVPPIWETFFDGTNGVLGDKKGAWESGVEAVNGGVWEKVFPPAP
jgi:hypothetical protein